MKFEYNACPKCGDVDKYHRGGACWACGYSLPKPKKPQDGKWYLMRCKQVEGTFLRRFSDDDIVYDFDGIDRGLIQDYTIIGEWAEVER